MYVAEIKKIYGYSFMSDYFVWFLCQRGDYREDSDVDIMILLDMSDIDLKEYSKQLSYMTYDFKEYGQ